jgi:hypothetical protein
MSNLNINELIGDDQPHRSISANKFVRDLIQKSSEKRTNISFVYKELLRSLLREFSYLSTINDEDQVISVKVIHANPERTVAKLTQETNLILPIVSISQPRTKRDSKRQKYKPLIISEKYWNEQTQRAIRIVSLADSPVEIEYELTVLSKYKNDLDQITEQIHGMFNPDIEITTKHSNTIKVYLMEETSDSEVVVSDREDRVLKRMFLLSASTYIPNPKFLMTSTGKIEDFNFDAVLVKRMS